TGIFKSPTGITLWVGTLVNSVLPPMDPQPTWYSSIESALQTSQQHSQTWLNETAPGIIADMSDAFIRYSGEFGNAVGDLKPLLADIAAHGNIPTANQVQDLTAAIGVLQQATAANQAKVRSLMTDMANYQSQMQADFAALKAALAAALPQEAADLAAVQQVQTQIQSIERALAADSGTATADSLDTTNAMISLVVGLTFAMGFEPVGFGMALLFVGVDAVIQASAEAQVISDLKQIEALTDQLAEDQMQLGLMQGIVSNLENLENRVQDAMATFDDVDDTWSFANYGLSYLQVVLAQPQIDISTIPDFGDLDDAIA